MPTSSTRTTCSLLILAAARASRRKRAAASPRSASSGCKTFTATGCSSSRWKAAENEPHAALPENAVDAVLAGEEIPFSNAAAAITIVLTHAQLENESPVLERRLLGPRGEN